MYKRVIIVVTAALGLLTSCSIKESRMQCPAYVSIQADCDTPGYAFYFSNGRLENNQRLTSEQLRSGDNIQSVSKGDIDVALITGLRENGGMQLTNGFSYMCPFGMDADPIYTFLVSQHIEDDAATLTGVLLKQHAHVHLTMKNGEMGDDYKYRIQVRGNYGAVDIYHTRAVEMPFCYEPQLNEQNVCEFNLNRQGDDSLVLDIYEKGKDGPLVDSLPLGEYIARTGYNWQTEILSDIRLTIDYARAEVGIEICDWDKYMVFSFII